MIYSARRRSSFDGFHSSQHAQQSIIAAGGLERSLGRALATATAGPESQPLIDIPADNASIDLENLLGQLNRPRETVTLFWGDTTISGVIEKCGDNNPSGIIGRGGVIDARPVPTLILTQAA